MRTERWGIVAWAPAAAGALLLVACLAGLVAKARTGRRAVVVGLAITLLATGVGAWTERNGPFVERMPDVTDPQVRDAVLDTYERVRQAVEYGDGTTAMALASEGSVSMWRHAYDLAVAGGPLEIEVLEPWERHLVMNARGSVPPEFLPYVGRDQLGELMIALDPPAAFVFSRPVSPDVEVRVEGGCAVVLWGGADTPFPWCLRYERQRWVVDQVDLFSRIMERLTAFRTSNGSSAKGLEDVTWSYRDIDPTRLGPIGDPPAQATGPSGATGLDTAAARAAWEGLYSGAVDHGTGLTRDPMVSVVSVASLARTAERHELESESLAVQQLVLALRAANPGGLPQTHELGLAVAEQMAILSLLATLPTGDATLATTVFVSPGGTNAVVVLRPAGQQMDPGVAVILDVEDGTWRVDVWSILVGLVHVERWLLGRRDLDDGAAMADMITAGGTAYSEELWEPVGG